MLCTRLILSLALLLGACAQPQQTKSAADTLTVLSYNIHHGEGNDGVFDLERLARVIRESDADLVALQEVDVHTGRSGGVDQAAELARLTGMQAVFGEAIAYDGGSYGDAVLSRLPILSSESWKLPAEPHHEERVAVSVVVETAAGQPVRFIGTHLDHTSDPSDRIRQTQALLLRAFPADKKVLPTLLLGDLNAEPDSEPLRLLLQRFASAIPGGAPSWPTEEPRKAIDWILFTPPNSWQVIEAGTMDEPLASDHLPLRAVLRYKAPR